MGVKGLKMHAISEEKSALLNICFSRQSLQAQKSRPGKVRMGYMTYLKEFLKNNLSQVKVTFKRPFSFFK